MPPISGDGPEAIQFVTRPVGDGGIGDGVGGASGSAGDGGSLAADGSSSKSALASIELSGDSSCTGSRIGHLDSVRVAVYDGTNRRYQRCISVPDPSSMSDIVAKLPNPVVGDLSAGSYLLVVTGHDNSKCSSSDVILCGGAKLTVPVSGRPKVQMSCRDDSNPMSAWRCRRSLP